uniref:Peptidase M14 domain-containing protein n=1 Tax=Bionectria ochroleuca TaxID=29856 RepID=A0A8H7TW20_BIOOC
MKFLSIITALLPLATAKVTYEGWKIFRVETEGAYEAIEPALTDIGTLLNIDKGYSAVTVAVAPEKFGAFEALGLTTTVLTENLAADLEVETHEPYEATVKTDDLEAAALPSITYFNAYHTLAEHNQFLVDLQAAFPSNSAIYTVGNSFEGRAIQGIHLWGTGGSGSKPAIVWHGNVHAREWITGVTVEYLAYKIVEQYLAGDSTVVTALNNYDFYITPIVNPDGFVYTSTERLWRKNRQTRSGVSCVGTDINRNWPYQWTGSGSPPPLAPRSIAALRRVIPPRTRPFSPSSCPSTTPAVSSFTWTGIHTASSFFCPTVTAAAPLLPTIRRKWPLHQAWLPLSGQ